MSQPAAKKVRVPRHTRKKMKLSEIKIPKRLRPFREDTVDSLADSIRECGLLHAIGVSADGELVYGRHRLAAAERLGWSDIEVAVLTLDDQQKRLAEIDENLVTNPLTVLERAEHLAERKSIYESIHPYAAHGKAPTSRRSQSNPETLPPSFAADASERTGRGQTVIREEVRMVTSIPGEVRDIIRETEAANRKQDLSKLARIKDQELQRRVAERVKLTGKSVATALRKETAPPPAVAKNAGVMDDDGPIKAAEPGKYHGIFLTPDWSAMPVSDVEDLTVPEEFAHPKDCLVAILADAPRIGDACRIAHNWGFEVTGVFTEMPDTLDAETLEGTPWVRSYWYVVIGSCGDIGLPGDLAVIGGAEGLVATLEKYVPKPWVHLFPDEERSVPLREGWETAAL